MNVSMRWKRYGWLCKLYLEILSRIALECQTVLTQTRSDKMLRLSRIQTVCKAYQQTTVLGKELKTPLRWHLVFNQRIC